MIKDSFIRYLQHEKRYSAHTIKSYRTDLNQFFLFCQEQGINEPVNADHKVIRNWIVSLMEKQVSTRSVNRKISTLKSFFRFLIREKHVDTNPVDKISTPKIKKKLPVFVEKDPMDTLLDNTDFGDDFDGIRNRLLLEMFYVTGIRLSELIGLKTVDINIDKQNLKVLGKRNKERIIPFNNSLLSTIKEYQKAKNDILGSNTEVYFFLTKKGKKLYKNLITD